MDLLIIKIKKETISSRGNSILEATRWDWVLNVNRAKKVDYVLATAEGKILDVFIAKEWLPSTHGHPGRYEFVGEPAPEKIRNFFKHDIKILPGKFTRLGIANPIIYATENDFEFTAEQEKEIEEKEIKSTESEQVDLPSYKIKAIVSSINFLEKTFKIKGCEGYFSEDENKRKWNLLKNDSEIKTFEADKDILKYGDKINDLWVVVSNALDSRRCYMFDVIIGDDDSLLVKSISQIDT